MTSKIYEKSREIGRQCAADGTDFEPWREAILSGDADYAPDTSAAIVAACVGILVGLEMAAAWHDAEAARIRAEVADPRFDGNERLMESGADDHENAAESIRAIAKTETPG